MENKSELLVAAIASITDEDQPHAIIPIFLGGSDDVHNAIMETAIAYVSFGSAREKGRDKEAALYKAKFDELREEHFPELNMEDAGAYCTIYFQFNRRYLDRGINKLLDIKEHEGFINRILVDVENYAPTLKPFISPIVGSVNKTMEKRDRMRRRHFGGPTQVADIFNVYLYNSFISVKIKRPSRLEYVNLINDIEMKLRYFGERWVINSINLERAGIAKIITEFFLDHVTYHSVEGLLSPQELSSYILANDINTMALALLQAGSPKGVFYNMTCLANKCKHSELVTVQPYDLFKLNEADMDDEQRDLWMRIRDKLEKISPEEIVKHQNRYGFKGKPVETAVKLFSGISEDESKSPYGQFTLAVPTLSEYFATFTHMAEKYDPAFKKYAIDYPAIDTYRKKRAEFAGAIRMGEYLHWIKNQITYPTGNDETVPSDVEDRGDDQRGFEDGLLDIFSDDDEAYYRTFGAIMEQIPYMTHSFIGFMNSDCPACKARAGAPEIKDGVEQPLTVHSITVQSGFTPIDVVTNFFDLTRMLIEEMGSAQLVQEEVTS